MLFQVTSRRRQKDSYGDEEQRNFNFDYLHDYQPGAPGEDGFAKRGKRGFEAALGREMIRLRDEVGVGTPKVGLYVHGYNTSYSESIDCIVDLESQLEEVIGYKPILVGFSWPSAGRTVEYLADREEARDSVPAFTRFLLDINSFLTAHQQQCFTTSYCIAHSMGNYLVRKGMEYLSDYLGTPVGRAMFNEMIMLAPDLASVDIEVDGKASYVAQFSRRIHVYYSPHDRALKASSAKRFGGKRLGRHGAEDYGNLPSNVVCINMEKFANSANTMDLRNRRGERVSVHSSSRYEPRILRDIERVMSSVDRALIPGRNPIHDIDRPSTDRVNHFALD